MDKMNDTLPEAPQMPQFPPQPPQSPRQTVQMPPQPPQSPQQPEHVSLPQSPPQPEHVPLPPPQQPTQPVWMPAATEQPRRPSSSHTDAAPARSPRTPRRQQRPTKDQGADLDITVAAASPPGEPPSPPPGGITLPIAGPSGPSAAEVDTPMATPPPKPKSEDDRHSRSDRRERVPRDGRDEPTPLEPPKVRTRTWCSASWR